MHAAADGVLAKIEAGGVIRAGTRASAPPFARKLENGGFEGFSVDLLEAIRASAEEKVGRPVALELREVTPADRLELVAAGELDIVCGITTPTWDREALVDFSVPFFRDGTRILIHREKATGGVDLECSTSGWWRARPLWRSSRTSYPRPTCTSTPT